MPNLRAARLLMWAVLFSQALAAQHIVLLDQQTRVPVHGAVATNLRNGTIDVSDYNGKLVPTNYLPTDTLYIDEFQHRGAFVLPGQVDGRDIYLAVELITFDGGPEITVYGRSERLSELPNKIDVIDAGAIRLKNPQTSADLLSQAGNVFVQKSQMGGGSPVLRGFEANKVLLVVDGVRMNNAIYRSGHLQNAITLDPLILKQVEVVFGPSSVAYGSDALGGVVHYRTRDPLLGEQRGSNEATGNLLARISSANQEKTFHADVAVGYERLGFLTSVTRSEYGDLRMGSNRRHGDETWGLLPVYGAYDPESRSDVIAENEDPELQVGTGYDQLDFTQKILLRASNTVSWKANFQYSTSSNIPRYDQLSDIRGGVPRWAEWYYGPQQRVFFSLQSVITDTTALYNSAIVTGAYQRIDETRIKRRFGQTAREVQDEDVWVYSLNADFERNLGSLTHFNYGVELVHNDVTSSAWSEILGSRERGEVATRYPNGGSSLSSAAAYFGLKRSLGEKTDLKAGARYTAGRLHAAFDENPFYTLPFDAVNLSRNALTGSLGLIYRPAKTWKVAAVVGNAFRLPNVDDVGKVRENDGFALIPTDQLGPEYAYNGELTLEKSLMGGRAQIALTGFYTLLRDAIVARNTTLNGQDSIEVEGTVARIQTNQNASQAQVYGYFAGFSAELTDRWNCYARYNFTYGQETESNVPLAHIPPVFASAGMNYSYDGFMGELSVLYNGAKSIDRYAPGGTDNADAALADGVPAWWTLNLNATYFISRTLQAQFGLENILDVHYRTFASGISAPGRNLILGLRATF